MKPNVGSLDRGIRLMLGAVLMYLGLMPYGGSALGVGLVAVGGMSLVTGLVGFCGLYRLLGVRTNSPREQP